MKGTDLTKIYLSPPDITAAEEASVVSAIRSGWVAPLGPEVDGFEQDMAERTGRAHAVALSSGTAALHLALVAWGVGPGDFIPTSAMTFAATANAITYTGATPVFIDCDLTTGNIDAELLDQAITDLRDQGKNVPAIVPVDLLGKCVDYESIRRVAAKHEVKVLLDSAESLGASSGGIPAGGFGDAAIVSFNGNKIMTTSGGGMLLTNDKALADKTQFLATQAREPAAHYEHREIGYNYRLSNLLAALGRAQLRRLDSMIDRRREHRREYVKFFSNVPGTKIFGHEDDEADNCWLTAVVIDDQETGWTAEDLMKALAEGDIESRPLWKPMHLQPAYAGRPAYVNGNSQRLFESGLTLPSGSAMTEEQFSRIRHCLSEFVERFK